MSAEPICEHDYRPDGLSVDYDESGNEISRVPVDHCRHCGEPRETPSPPSRRSAWFPPELVWMADYWPPMRWTEPAVVPHDHREPVAACFRCELSRDEATHER